MSRPTLDIHSHEGESGQTWLTCPGPGRVRWMRSAGEVLVPGSVVGVLVRGERSFDLVTPAGTRGQIASISVGNRWNDCEHGTKLASLVEVAAGADAAGSAARAGDEGDESGFFLRSTTHGTFYRRPSPDAPLYVDAGQTIEAGATVGLVEVMKCFSPVTFAPPAGSTSGIVEEVLVQDGAEVRAEQPLLRLRLS